MKKATLFIVLLGLVIACQERLPLQDGKHAPLATKSISDEIEVQQIDEQVLFLTDTDFDAWTSIRSLEDRFAACNVPYPVSSMMTTESLVKSVLHYPLNYLIFAYNDPYDAVNLICENSELHKELLSRSNAASELVEAFAESTMTLDIEKEINKTYSANELSYTNGMFLEYLLGSGLVSGLSDGANREVLRQAVSDKIESRAADTLNYSTNSLRSLYNLDSREGLQVISSVNGGEVTGTTTVSTYFGKTITGLVREEFSNQELINITNQAVSNYPDAIVRGSATAKYNCHSYAWHNNSLNNSVWINAANNGSLQLSKYWTDDLFVSCSDSLATRAYYSDGDHSAVVLPSGKFLSKWGGWPLMEHDYDYCPYILTNLQYFKLRSEPIFINSGVTGDANVRPNTVHLYYVSNQNSSTNYQWVVSYMDNLTTTPGTCELTTVNRYSCQLNCFQYGLYRLKAYGYYEGACVSLSEQYIISGEF
jgi:hypothetical protein